MASGQAALIAQCEGGFQALQDFADQQELARQTKIKADAEAAIAKLTTSVG